MMISALEQLIPLFFALDHTHYARWASVFLQDLKELKWKQPESKNAQFKAWMNHSKLTELTAALRGLRCCPDIETVKNSMEVIEPWAMSWYNKAGLYDCASIDGLRFQLFTLQ